MVFELTEGCAAEIPIELHRVGPAGRYCMIRLLHAFIITDIDVCFEQTDHRKNYLVYSDSKYRYLCRA